MGSTAGAALAPLSYLALMAAGVVVLSVACSAVRYPAILVLDPIGWLTGRHVIALDLGIALFLSVMPSANHTFQLIGWACGHNRWRMWPLYWTMVALPVVAGWWVWEHQRTKAGLILAGVLAGGTLLSVLGFPKRDRV